MGVVLALVLAVSASNRHEAEDLYRAARSDQASGSPKMALTEATHAYALDSKPMYLLEIAECQRDLGRWAEAAVSYQRYLAVAPARNRSAAKKALAEVQSHLGNLPPAKPAAGGELAIAPLVATPLLAPPAAEPPAPPRTPVTALPPPPAPPAAVSDTPEVGAVSAGEEDGHTRIWAYSLVGLAVASAAVGTVGWVNVASYNSYVSSVTSGELVSTGSTARQNLSSAQTWQIVAIATTIATGLAAGGAVFTW
jgi:tetratricopeptide (TPR) repeat protein